MKIGLTEFILVFCIAAVAIGPGVAAFLSRWSRRAKKSYKAAQRRYAAAAIEYRTEREMAIARLQKFGFCILAMLIAVLAYTLLLRPIEAEPQPYTAPAVRDATGAPLFSTGGMSVSRYEDITCVREKDGTVYFSAAPADDKASGVLARMSGGSGAVTILQTEGRITCFDFAPDGSIWLTLLTDDGGALCRASYDEWGSAIESVVTQINGAALSCPTAVAVGADGKVYFAALASASAKHGVTAAMRTELIAHTATGQVYVYDPAALSVQRVLGGVAGASGVALAPDGGTLYVSDLGSRCIWAVDTAGRGLLAGGKSCEAFAAELPGYPAALAADTDGTVYVSYIWEPSRWLETNAGSKLLRGVALRLPRNLRAGLFDMPKEGLAAEALAPGGEPQAALYLDFDSENGTLSGREPGIFWDYRTK